MLALLLPACQPAARPLRVGMNIWPGYEPLTIARSLGYLDPAAVQLVDFSTAAEVVRAWHNGVIDVAALTADEAILASEGDTPGRIVLVCDYSNGADALIAPPSITSMQQLKGRRVGVEMMAVGAYTLARALKLSNLSHHDVVTVPLSYKDQVEAMRSGAVDAMITFEPNRSTLLADGGHILFDSSMIPGEIVDVLLARADLQEEHERALQHATDAWFRALDYIASHPDDAAARAAPREGISVAQFRQALETITLIDLPTNRRLLGASSDNLAARFRALSDVMREHRLVPEVPPPPPLDDRYVRAVRP